MAQKIKIEGDSRSFDLQDVDGSVIQLSGKWFWRDDSERVTRVTVNGKKRYYRLKSNLICFCETTKKHELKSQCVLTKDNLWLLKEHENTVLIDGQYYQKKYTVEIGNQRYLLTDDRIVKDYNHLYILKKDALALSSKFYQKNLFISKNSDSYVTTENKEILLAGDATKVYDVNKNFVYKHFLEVEKLKLRNILIDFRDRNTPELRPNRLILGYVAPEVVTVESDVLHMPVIASQQRELEEIYLIYQEKINKESIEKVRASMNKTYDEAGPDENQAKIISLNYNRYPGNQILFQPQSRGIAVSKNKGKTSGIDYTFGIEFETSAGLLADSTCETLGLIKVGDGSIGSAEYVTSPLHGDLGVEALEKAANTLAKSTFVDNRCALHIHVGGASGTSSPSFDIPFLINSIALGSKVEEDLFKMCPKSRHPEFKHCHSIIRYKGINTKNYKGRLGHFIFGPRENWSNRIKFNDYEYGVDGQDINTGLGLYAGGRYKWLNLINCASRARHKTIENRLFPGTTSFHKVYNFLLITLAFVRFADTQDSKLIRGETPITLFDVVDSSITDSSLNSQVKKFIEDRTNKFKRKNLYINLAS
jgi:hypothetical protein